MAEDFFCLELQLASESTRDQLYAMFCGAGPAFKEEMALDLHALFDVMEAKPIVASGVERLGSTKVRASWRNWTSGPVAARVLCEACAACGPSSLWAFYFQDTAKVVWSLDAGKLRRAAYYDSQGDQSLSDPFGPLFGFDAIASIQSREAKAQKGRRR